MSQSAHHAPPGASDPRDGLGYAIAEIGLGILDGRGRFHDLLRHQPDRSQSCVYVSSTDPWHREIDRDSRVEQPGFDRVFSSGLGGGQPVLMPAGVLYDTPDNAAAELRYLRRRCYPVTQMELGEEPDGQYASPEDYAALYGQWARALKRIDPSLKIGGPSLQTDVAGWRAWPDLRGQTAWVTRFLATLRTQTPPESPAFFSFEWYPFDDVCAPSAPQLALAPELLRGGVTRLRREGVPFDLPLYITEYGYSAFAGRAEADLPGALLNAEIAAQFVTLGGARAYLYGLEPNSLIRESTDCDLYGRSRALSFGRRAARQAATGDVLGGAASHRAMGNAV